MKCHISPKVTMFIQCLFPSTVAVIGFWIHLSKLVQALFSKVYKSVSSSCGDPSSNHPYRWSGLPTRAFRQSFKICTALWANLLVQTPYLYIFEPLSCIYNTRFYDMFQDAVPVDWRVESSLITSLFVRIYKRTSQLQRYAKSTPPTVKEFQIHMRLNTPHPAHLTRISKCPLTNGG